jgi:hypothetical protein
MHRSAFQDLQQVEPTGSVLVKRASRGSATPGNSLVSAALARICGRQTYYNVCSSYQQRSGCSGPIFVRSSDVGQTKQQSCRAGQISVRSSDHIAKNLRLGCLGNLFAQGSEVAQRKTKTHPLAKPTRFPQAVACKGPVILPRIALANTAINRTTTGRLRLPLVAGYVQR